MRRGTLTGGSTLTTEIQFERTVHIKMVHQVSIVTAHTMRFFHFVKHRLDLLQVEHPIGQNCGLNKSNPTVQLGHG